MLVLAVALLSHPEQHMKKQSLINNLAQVSPTSQEGLAEPKVGHDVVAAAALGDNKGRVPSYEEVMSRVIL